MRLPHTSRDLKFSFLPSPLTQNLDKQVNSNINKESSQSIPPKKSFQKKSLKKNLPKKFLPKKSSQKISPQKILQKIPPKKSFGKIPWKFQKKIHRNFQNQIQKFQKFPNNVQKDKKKFQTISNPNFKFLRFWKYPIPYIALGGRKPFWACYQNQSTLTPTACFISTYNIHLTPWLRSVYYTWKMQALNGQTFQI